ncbi:MAG: type II secretion system protein [Phycisphaerales bacterium]
MDGLFPPIARIPKRRTRSAFTLIELLVVIAITSLLMSVLMPSLSEARKQARAVACRGLLKQWGSIWYLYCNDNNGSFASGNISGVD